MDGLSDTESLQIELKAPKQFQVGMEVLCVGLNNTNATAKFMSKSSGSYRYDTTYITYYISVVTIEN